MPAASLEPVSGDAVVLVNELVKLAVAQRASDIHLEPKHDKLQVRLRVDGALVDVQLRRPGHLHERRPRA